MPPGTAVGPVTLGGVDDAPVSDSALQPAMRSTGM
jgi:hypothetical protein